MAMNPTHPRGRQALALASLSGMAMLWGSTFFSTKALVAAVPVADMLAVRFAMATLVLGLVAWRHWRMSRATLRQGLLLGLLYSTAQLTQTFGLAHTTASLSGFVTGLYVVFTPLLAAALLRERVPASTWLAVALATLGLGVLTLRGGAAGVGLGEVLTLACAGLYALHIIAVDRFATPENSLQLTNVQMAVCTVVMLVAASPGGLAWPRTGGQWAWLVYLAVLAGAVPIFLQIWAQSYVESTTAAVLMSAEPVWSAVFAVLFGGERVSWQMVVGGAAMVAAMLLVTVMPRLKRVDAGAARISGSQVEEPA